MQMSKKNALILCRSELSNHSKTHTRTVDANETVLGMAFSGLIIILIY